ncbi:MAG: lipoyl(octanoyl) transferase LipB [Pseudanabaenaceae cyanobacterium SKYGB_i_bin29]|nr:lipoyl(octanoyl) transferase LipB [Pseudanabaenaceae cyanobacterium SKYG29]MDW8422308.1 lipoyl(octanoyl) transferase LipB [Pseudanabaenaceae cyanobacterium SKYGB_i_bin29]
MTLLVYRCRPLIPYHLAWQWQKELVQERKQNPHLPDVLLLLEHPAVYTIGQGSNLAFFKQSVDYIKTERGGEVTYHAPGQLVGYPIVNLRHYQPDLHWYLRSLEEVIIQALATLGIQAERRPGLTGVWVETGKIAQIGIKVSRWITMHGFALNVSVDKEGFQPIVPCGIPDCPVANVVDFLSVDMETIKDVVEKQFVSVFLKSKLTESQVFAAMADAQAFRQNTDRVGNKN